jgi:Uma2 family endonuclease
MFSHMTRPEALNVIRPLPLTVADFLLLDENGAFDGYGKTELLNGEIYYMNAQHSRHGRIKMRLASAIITALGALGSNLETMIEVSVRIEPSSAPIPDIVVTRYSGDDLIPVDTVALTVEVADTTQKSDLGSKASLYATAKVPEYWVFDAKAGVLHQMWSPKGETYTQSRQIQAGQMITAETIDGLTIRLPA